MMVKGIKNFLKSTFKAFKPIPTIINRKTYVNKIEMIPGIPSYALDTVEVDLKISVHTFVFIPQPKISRLMNNPKESINTKRPIQSESQSSLIKDLFSEFMLNPLGNINPIILYRT